MAYDATDRRTADRSDGAAARKDRTPDGTYAGANGRVPVLRRHPGTTTQAEHRRRNKRTNRKPSHRFHWNTSI